MPHVPDTNWNYSAINNLKKRPSFRYCLSLCAASLSFLTERKKTTLLSSDWSESRLSFSSPLCWQVNLCLVEDERTVAFSTERTEPLLPVSSALHSHTVTHIAYMGGVLSHFTVLERKSCVPLFKAFNHIVPAVSGDRQWFNLLLNCVCSRVWRARGSCLNRSMHLWGES